MSRDQDFVLYTSMMLLMVSDVGSSIALDLIDELSAFDALSRHSSPTPELNCFLHYNQFFDGGVMQLIYDNAVSRIFFPQRPSEQIFATNAIALGLFTNECMPKKMQEMQVNKMHGVPVHSPSSTPIQMQVNIVPVYSATTRTE